MGCVICRRGMELVGVVTGVKLNKKTWTKNKDTDDCLIIHKLVLTNSIWQNVLGAREDWLALESVLAMKRWGWPITFKTERNAAESIDHEGVLKKENVEDHKQSKKTRRRL